MRKDEFIAGWTAAFINISALFPVNKLIFRQMAGGHNAPIAAKQMREEGLTYLYRGILPPLIQKTVSVSIMYGTFSHYKRWADSELQFMPPIANLVLSSCMTGATEAVLTPLERVQMLLQDRRYHSDYRNTIDALAKMRVYGPKEYYRGLTCVLVRNCPSNVLFFGLRDEIKKLLTNFKSCETSRQTNSVKLGNLSNKSSSISSSSFVSPALYGTKEHQVNTLANSNPAHIKRTSIFETKDGIIEDFLSGAILGSFISTLFYPFSVVRTRMQTRAPGTEFLTISKALKAVYNERDRKLTRLFHGCLINVLRQSISWGVINSSYEFVLNYLRRHD